MTAVPHGKETQKNDASVELLTRANKKAWAEHERRTRQELEDSLRSEHGDQWMEDNRELLGKDWERVKDLIL